MLGTGDPNGVESLDNGGVVPLTIFMGLNGDLMLESLSESSVIFGVSEKLLKDELGLELSETQLLDLGVSALEDGLDELFFLGDGLSSL